MNIPLNRQVFFFAVGGHRKLITIISGARDCNLAERSKNNTVFHNDLLVSDSLVLNSVSGNVFLQTLADDRSSCLIILLHSHDIVHVTS